MSPETLLEQKKKQAAPSEDLLIDTSKMNEQQAAAMEVAELARDEASHLDSFAGRLFMGSFVSTLIAPFPRQSEKDRACGDEIVRQVSEFLAQHLDADVVDETRTIPQDVIEGLRDLGVFRMKIPEVYGGFGDVFWNDAHF